MDTIQAKWSSDSYAERPNRQRSVGYIYISRSAFHKRDQCRAQSKHCPPCTVINIRSAEVALRRWWSANGKCTHSLTCRYYSLINGNLAHLTCGSESNICMHARGALVWLSVVCARRVCVCMYAMCRRRPQAIIYNNRKGKNLFPDGQAHDLCAVVAAAAKRDTANLHPSINGRIPCTWAGEQKL